MPLPRTALFASWTHKFVHHRCESPCSTNRNKLSRHRPKELLRNSEKSCELMSHAGKHQYRGQHNSSRYSRNSLQTSASISSGSFSFSLSLSFHQYKSQQKASANWLLTMFTSQLASVPWIRTHAFPIVPIVLRDC